jgi:hypothetical protein
LGQARTLRLSDRAWYCLFHTKPVYGHGPNHSRSSTTQHCHGASQLLRISSPQPRDLDRPLGHYNTRAIIDPDMAQTTLCEVCRSLSLLCHRNVTIAFSDSRPVRCPSARDGLKATRRLERASVNICGPTSVTTKSGRLYPMNTIGDYSSYVSPQK